MSNILEKIDNYLSEESEYQKFFNKMLDKYSVDSPADLSDKEKKKFFDEIDKGYKSKREIGLK